MAAESNNTNVVVHSVGPVILDDHANKPQRHRGLGRLAVTPAGEARIFQRRGHAQGRQLVGHGGDAARKTVWVGRSSRDLPLSQELA